MSQDVSFDMQQSGRRVRCLTVPFRVEDRELGTGRTIANVVTETESSTLGDLLEERRHHRSGIDPVNKIQHDYAPDEYHVPVNRERGIVGDDR